MNDLQKYKDAMPKGMQDTLDRTWNYTDRGNLSMKSVSYNQVKKIGKFVTNNVPKKDKDLFVKTYVSNSVSDFWGKYRKSKRRDYRWR